ncbi:MAG: glycosyltransferase family 2 protein [Kordiimonadaceae bacterium]|nr:glycosyltransferase family 2 protein [Kordiimonadaceae bacterium]
MINNHKICVLIPALNEEETLPHLLAAIPTYVDNIIVVDNGSTDHTAVRAKIGGAQVVSEPRRGYGQACLSGIRALPACDIVIFLDADFCEDPAKIANLCAPIIDGNAEMVLGSRMHESARQHLTPPQRLGNGFACWLMNLIWRTNYTDLGPFRAVTPAALSAMQMQDRDFGWTVEMQINAAKAGVRTAEINVPYRHRLYGKSKISGTVGGVLRAGSKILYVIAREIWRGKRGWAGTNTAKKGQASQ